MSEDLSARIDIAALKNRQDDLKAEVRALRVMLRVLTTEVGRAHPNILTEVKMRLRSEQGEYAKARENDLADQIGRLEETI